MMLDEKVMESRRWPRCRSSLRPPPFESAVPKGALAGRKVLIIVENLPVPFDRRVWQEARTLKAAGAKVSIICRRA